MSNVSSRFEDHEWDCRRDETAVDPWLWEVYRDGELVGYLKSEKSGFLAADNQYEAFDANSKPLTVPSWVLDDSNYTNMLRLINGAADGLFDGRELE